MILTTNDRMRLPDWAPEVPKDVRAAHTAVLEAVQATEAAGVPLRDARDAVKAARSRQDKADAIATRQDATERYEAAQRTQALAERRLQAVVNEHANEWAPKVDALMNEAIDEAHRAIERLAGQLAEVRQLRGLLTALETGDLENVGREGLKHAHSARTINENDVGGMLQALTAAADSARTAVRIEQRARRAADSRVNRRRAEVMKGLAPGEYGRWIDFAESERLPVGT